MDFCAWGPTHRSNDIAKCNSNLREKAYPTDQWSYLCAPSKLDLVAACTVYIILLVQLAYNLHISTGRFDYVRN